MGGEPQSTKIDANVDNLNAWMRAGKATGIRLLLAYGWDLLLVGLGVAIYIYTKANYLGIFIYFDRSTQAACLTLLYLAGVVMGRGREWLHGR